MVELEILTIAGFARRRKVPVLFCCQINELHSLLQMHSTCNALALASQVTKCAMTHKFRPVATENTDRDTLQRHMIS